MKLFTLLSPLGLLLFSSISLAGPVRLPIAWTADTSTLLETAPAIIDLSGDGSHQVVVMGREEVIAINSDGTQRWRWRTPARFMTYPAALEQKGKPALIFATDNGGQMICLNGKGEIVWQKRLKTGASWSSAVVTDLNHDGSHQVVQTEDSGLVHAYDAVSGHPLWSTQLKGSPVSPAVGIVSDNLHNSVAVATGAGQLSLLNSKGAIQWTRNVSAPSDSWQTSAPVIFRASDGKARIVVGASDGRISCFDAHGALLWVHKTLGYVASSISVGDLEHRGRADIFAITGTGVIYRFDESGRQMWKIDMQGRSIGAGALIDLQNSGSLNYIVSTQSGHLMAFNRDAEVVFDHQFPNRTINMTPTFGHVTPKSGGLNMVIGGGESGSIFCFETPASLNSPAANRCWTAYRGDVGKSGGWFGLQTSTVSKKSGVVSTAQITAVKASAITSRTLAAMAPTPATAAGRVATGDTLQFTVNAPAGTSLPLHASATCFLPDGSLQKVLTPIYGLDGELRLPIDLLLSGQYRLTWSAADANGKKFAEGSGGYQLQPFQYDRQTMGNSLSALNRVAASIAPVLPLTAHALHVEANLITQLAAAAEPGQKGLVSPESSTIAATRRLVAEARRGLAIVSAAKIACTHGKGTSLLAFQSTQWTSGSVDLQTPTAAGLVSRETRRVVPGRHDAVSIKLFNVTDRELVVRLSADTAAGGPLVKLLRSVSVPTKQGGVAWDVLTELDETGTINIPSLSTREVWVDAGFKGVSPGTFGVKLHCLALNGAGVLEGPKNALDVPAPETIVDLRYRVLPFALAGPEAFRMCCWATYTPGAIGDMLEHGNNVFTGPFSDPVYTALGTLTGFDYSKLDILLDAMRGWDVVVLVEGKPALKAPEGSEQYETDLKRCLNDLTEHLAGRGIDLQHFALYPYDEPGGAGWQAVNGLAAFGKQVKAVNPNIKIYIDGGGEADMFKKMAPYVDIWCPPIGMPADKSPEMQVINDSHKEVWTYDCGYSYTSAMDANLKDTNIVAEFGVSALFAARWNVTGIGFWCYNIGTDPWQRQAADYALVYPGATKPVSSRRWEAVRQSIEDTRMVLALKSLATSTDNDALRRQIRDLIDVALPKLVDRSHQEVVAGLGRTAFTYSQNDATLAAFRKQLYDCVEAASERQ